MYISSIKVKGYKNAFHSSTVVFNRGLNILLGENGCGKTAIINSLRLIFKETESYSSFSEDDFYCSLDKKIKASEIEIDAEFFELDENEKITFLTWCDSDFNAQLHLSIAENLVRPGNYKRRYWGGRSLASAFEEDTFDRIECIYLPPLRDAESKLSNGRRSRLAMLLKKQYGDNTDALVDSVKDFNNNITENKDGNYSELDSVRKTINKKVVEALGKQLGQSINLQFSETTFSKIVENIRMVFFPHSGETDIMKFRDLATNSLGYNNLLYIATVFSELELIKDSDIFTVLLIEEPEAHLHPQLQVKFIKYLQELSSSLKNAQIIVSTHSPILASSVDIDKIIHIWLPPSVWKLVIKERR
ncbi:MAG: ATP-dependent nuclease [Syntrophomonadaceae bacterium]|jgi:putative ATP-dependent endonuclease of OLD family